MATTHNENSEEWNTYRREVVNTMERLVNKVEKLEFEIMALKLKVAFFAGAWSIASSVATHFLLKIIHP